MKNIEKVLAICLTCKDIRIDDETGLWLSEKTDTLLYKKFCEKFKGRLSYGYCPEHVPIL